MITRNYRELTRSSFCRVLWVSRELRLISTRNRLAVWSNRDDVTIWNISYSNNSIWIISSYCSTTSSNLRSSVALDYWSVDLTKCVATSEVSSSLNIWRFNLLPSLTVNKFNSLTTSVGFWGIRNIPNRNVFARFARNRIYRFTSCLLYTSPSPRDS